MPEEINRVVTDALADYRFTTERSTNEDLGRESIPEHKTFFVRNVTIDTLLRHRSHAEALRVPARYEVVPHSYAMLTLHRPSNVDSPEVLGGILDALDVIQARLRVLFPAHPRTLKQLAHSGLLRRLDAMPGLRHLPQISPLVFWTARRGTVAE